MIETRLREVLKMTGWSYQKLAEAANIPLETMRNIYYGKVKDPKCSTMLAISDVLHISVNYLLGEATHTLDEEKLIRNYRQCGKHGKSMLLTMSQNEADHARAIREKKSRQRISCFVPSTLVDGFKFHSAEQVAIFADNPDAYMAIEITSNAFAPVYCQGDIILIEDRYPNSGEKGVFTKDDLSYIRTFLKHEKGYTLKSLTRQSKNFEFKRMDSVECMGTIIDVISD